MPSWAARNTARAINARTQRLAGLAFLALIVLLQPWGLTAADTKHDLAANPAGFLRGALSVYTDNFTLGQIQNQAYGYLFPQGPFFLLTDFLPDWVAQRLWWFIVLAVGFVGFHLLASKVGLRGWGAWVAALLYALSPRVLSTLTAISSETWPVMLAPWVLLPLLNERLTWRDGAVAAIPVALMGAVNATATLAACVPALVVVLYRKAWRPGAAWLGACALVSVWWIIPLLVLGRYAPPFTEFIESAHVTTRWLNLPEILRGATSWSPFVDTERVAGFAVATEPIFILATTALAAMGLYGLFRLPRVWALMLVVGIAILATQAQWYLDALDGPLAALRNLHKFDPLVRIPLLLGVAAACARLELLTSLRPPRRAAQGMLVVLVAAIAIAPAWSQRLLPLGAYEEVPDYWHEAADFLNENAANTRTLIYPEASFARQEWGWTRDEPAQPLLDVPWAVRDAIPLIPPEAIRGLDGLMATMEESPEQATRALERLGIGAVLLRHDLEHDDSEVSAQDFDGEVHTFGEVDVVMLNRDANVSISDTDAVSVAGGGESLAFLDAFDGPAARELVDQDAEIVTDTPTLTDRNYGTLNGPISAPLAERDPSTVNNRLRDYPSAGAPVTVEERGGTVAASSSNADADALGGAKPARGVSAAVDGENTTAWWPAPGDSGWIELRGEFPNPRLDIMATKDTTVTIRSGEAAVEVDLRAYRSKEVAVPGGDTDAIRVELDERAGIAELAVQGQPVERVVTVPDTSENVRQFFFQQMLQDTRVLIREFTVPRAMTVEISGTKPVLIDGTRHQPGDTIDLTAGQHLLRTTGAWVSLRDVTWQPPQDYQVSDGSVAAADEERLLITGRAFNEGLRGFVGDEEQEPREIDAATQAFVIPAGVAGEFRMEHAAQRTYLAGLVGGGAVGLISLGVLLLLRRPARPAWREQGAAWPVAVCGLGALALVSWPAALVGVAAWAVLRWTTLPAPWLSAGLMLAAGAMLARAPWPDANYAGDSLLLELLVAAALACLWAPGRR